MRRYVPALEKVLIDYPQAALPGLQETFLWLKSIVRGKATYVLAPVLAAGQGSARAVLRREFYASTGYNAEQSVAGFIPRRGRHQAQHRQPRHGRTDEGNLREREEKD